MTKRKLTIPIGCNAHLDGGPFESEEGLGMDAPNGIEDGTLVSTDGDRFYRIEMNMIQDAFEREMTEHQPIQLSTGDVGEDAIVGTIEVPLIDGYYVSTYELNSRVYNLSNLRRDYLTRRSIERKLKKHGGTLEG